MSPVTTRAMEARERPYSCGETSMPVVIEARRFQDVASLKELVARDSQAIKSLLYEHGAIVFRGFDVARDDEFEGIVTSIDGTQPMNGYFMSEPGRALIDGTRGVFNTNSLYKTGGALYLGGFHSENFYSTDVPALQSMWCKEPPTLGGETALVQSANVYDDLPRALQQKLADGRVFARAIPLVSVAARYGLPVEQVESFCREAGLEIADGGSEGASVQIFKPVVYKHPHTGRLALQVNVSGEVAALDGILRRLLAPKYRGWRWALHRIGWQSPKLAPLLPALESWPLFVDTLSSALEGVIDRVRPKRDERRAQTASPARFAERLTNDDVEALARAIGRHTSLFTWRRGDVLVFDNLQVLHAGMPGRGRRELRVMMCDPIRMDLPITSGLFEAPASDRTYESIGARLERLAESGRRAGSAG